MQNKIPAYYGTTIGPYHHIEKHTVRNTRSKTEICSKGQGFQNSTGRLRLQGEGVLNPCHAIQ